MTTPVPPSRRRLILAVLCGSIAFAASGCKEKPETAPAPEVYVQVAQPRNAAISEQITADATLAPLAQAAISPRVSAPVKRFYVQRGSMVRAGQLLATLENSDLAAAVADNKGAYTAAQGTFETETKATVPQDTIKARQDLRQAQATLDLNRSIVNSRSQLFAQGAIPGRDLDTARAALVQAQSAFDIAKEHLASVEQVSRQSAIATAQGQLASARGKYLGAEAQLSYTEIHSPISGVVTDRPLFAGETASAGTPLLTVMDTSALLAKLHLAQRQAQQLALGAPATITVPGIDDPVPARVSLISPALDPGSTTVEVWLRVENPKSTFKVGTPVHTTITGRIANNALVVPTDAIQAGADGASKFVMVMTADGTAHKKPVTLGIQTPETTQILDGVSPADTVIVTGGYGLDDGTKVKVGKAPSDDQDDKKPAAGAKKDEDDK
jgi:HlyD family secretion protein